MRTRRLILPADGDGEEAVKLFGGLGWEEVAEIFGRGEEGCSGFGHGLGVGG